MKKKIGDFTLREIKSHCEKNKDCKQCELYNIAYNCCELVFIPDGWNVDKEVKSVKQSI